MIDEDEKINEQANEESDDDSDYVPDEMEEVNANNGRMSRMSAGP